MPEPADHQEGEGTPVPRPPGSGRGWAQLEVSHNVSLRPPEVTSHEVSWEANLLTLRDSEEGLESSLAPGWPSQGWWGILSLVRIFLLPPSAPKGCFSGRF